MIFNNIFKIFRLSLFTSFLLFNVHNPCLAADPVDNIVAVVNDDVVMLSELEDRVRTIAAQLRQQNKPLPPRQVFEQQILESIIIAKVQLQVAERTGIRVDDETLNQSVQNMARQNGVSLGEFRDILQADGYSFEKFREDIRNEIAISRLRQRQIINRVSVTDREIDTFLANAETQGLVETQYRIGHILISAADSSDEQRQQKRAVAEQVLAELRAGEDFAALAGRVSDGQQAESGGDLGWRTKADIPSLFSGEVNGMQSGDVSDIIENTSGFHIIKLLGIKSGDKKIIRQTHASHILIKTNEVISNQVAQEKLQQFLYRIEQGEDFAQIAKSNSDDMVSALEGGDLGWRSPGELVPEFDREMNALAIGQISEPFQSQFGWHIIKVHERRDFDNTQNAQRSQAREAIRQRKIKENEQEWLRNLREEAYVEYRLNG